MKTTDKPIIVEQNLNQSIETVWHAITKVELMRQWFFDNIPDFKPEVGFKTQFNVASPNRNFLHLWKITEVVPLKKITYSFQSKNQTNEIYRNKFDCPTRLGKKM